MLIGMAGPRFNKVLQTRIDAQKQRNKIKIVDSPSNIKVKKRSLADILAGRQIVDYPGHKPTLKAPTPKNFKPSYGNRKNFGGKGWGP